jgi:predicted RNA-binding protein with PIN domain
MPADDLTAAGPAPVDARSADVGGGLAPDDPAFLERLLLLPRAHLVVDAYNVTKAAYGDLALLDQRRRLIGGLAGLAARTSAEVTAVFDGAAVGPVPAAPSPRGVRVLFSAPGETADALVLRVVGAEPVGRPVVVVSSDREVASGATDAGARAVASRALIRLLERG